MCVQLIVYLDENGECLRIEDVDIFVLSAHNEAADSISFIMTLLERCDASDDRLTLQRNVLEYCHKWQKILIV